MLRTLHLRNFTVFSEANLAFSKHLNVAIGENGTGKSHLLKVAYSAIAVSAAKSRESERLPTALADKLMGVFRADRLGRMVQRRLGRGKCELSYGFSDRKLDLAYSFSTLASSEVKMGKSPAARVEKPPVFLPTRELLTIYPGFVSLYETSHLPFEETWRDTCILLGAPLARGPREGRIRELLRPLEEALGGKVVLEPSGSFYLRLHTGNMEMHLVAEGLRKLAMMARLVATGSLLDKGYLFWDEPEANLNPRIIKLVARTIVQVALSGIQVFVATHSLFLLRELHILQQAEFQTLETRCFGLHTGENGSVEVKQGASMDEIGDIAVLDEDVQQAERYIDTEMGVQR